MPSARESLLEAAHAAVSTRPWASVRMVDLAASAGVSRQTLYNEFGNKEGLGRALVRHRVEGFLGGAAAVAAQAVRGGADTPSALAVATGWMLRTIGGEPVVRCALTGCWTAWMPPAARGEPAAPWELAAELRSRLLAVLGGAGGDAGTDGVGTERLHLACEAGLRLALSYVVVPVPGAEDEVCARIRTVTRSLLRPAPP